jgi:hypothetical protein
MNSPLFSHHNQLKNNLLIYLQANYFQEAPFAHEFIEKITDFCTQQYCHVEFSFKQFFDKINFLKIINL